jgi:hypothetical protein
MRRLGILACVIVACGLAQAEATPVYFSYKGTATGTIGSSDPFTLEYEISARGEYENRKTLAGGTLLVLEHDAAQIKLPGAPPAGFFYISSPTRTVVNLDTGVVSFARGGDTGASLITGPASAALVGWQMDSSAGPVIGTATHENWYENPPIEATIVGEGGVLRFYPTTTAPFSFTSTGVPEPASCLLAGGLVAISLFARPRRTKRTFAETTV